MIKEKKLKLSKGELSDEEQFLRENKARILNFEFISLHNFAISSNFLTPDNIVNMI